MIILLNIKCILTNNLYHYHHWKKDHYDCYTEIKVNNDYINNDTPISITSGMITSNITCVEATYMEYARLQYNKTDDQFKKSILLSIINLYKDLEHYRKPSSIYMESLGANSSMLVYPISFAIPEQFVLRTVPPKSKGKHHHYYY